MTGVIMRALLLGTALLAGSTPAAADVVTASSNGFEVRETVNLAVRPEAAFAAFGNIGGWWDAQHTYSGDSSNLRLTLTPGGCFCERFPDGGGIEHMRVTFVEPGKHLILTGTLGPLLYEASRSPAARRSRSITARRDSSRAAPTSSRPESTRSWRTN